MQRNEKSCFVIQVELKMLQRTIKQSLFWSCIYKLLVSDVIWNAVFQKSRQYFNIFYDFKH